MARLYKGTDTSLNLFLPCNYEYTGMSVILYTTNPEEAVNFEDVKVENNVVSVRIKQNDLVSLEDGIINYIIKGDNNITIERQSNFYLKTPTKYTATDITTEPLREIVCVDNGEYNVKTSPGYIGMEEVKIIVDVPIEDIRNESYTQGYETGREVQKDLLEPITITENGTYTREDGYNEIHVDVPDLNGSYDDGYNVGKQDGIDYASENAGEIAAANAIDLVATEFGTYYTKYSDNIVNPNPLSGVFPDGETFHNLAKVSNNIYNTGIIPNENTKLEFWFIPDIVDNTKSSSVIILTNNSSLYGRNFGVYQRTAGNQTYEAQIGSNTIIFNLNNSELYHIILSVADGLVINGEQIGTFSSSASFNVPLYINGTSFDTQGSADGDFGMIKIFQDGVENIIIPTEDGFLNTTTNQLLEVVYNEGTYEYINNSPIILDNLIKSVDVQVKIKLAESNIKLGYSKFSEVPEYFDFNGVTDLSSMFYECRNLTSIPELDTSNVPDMSYMFYYCRSLTTIPKLDTSNVTNMKDMFYYCDNLETIPELNTSNVTNMEYIFANCQKLTTIPKLDTSNVTTMYYMFYNCKSLKTIPELDTSNVTNMKAMFLNNMYDLTDVGGWKNLKCDWNDTSGLVKCPNLTYQSCINILNGLADVTELGVRTLKVHQNFIDLVGDEISIGTMKGWQIIV